MRIRILALLSALCFVGSVVTAVAGPDDVSEPGPNSCNLDSYISIGQSTNTVIPDGSALVLGPISFPYRAGLTIQDVIVGLEIQHPSVGDLTISVMRVHGTKVHTVKLLDRPGYPERLPAGCQSELDSASPDPVWHFGDDGSYPMADGATCLPDGQNIPLGCYQVAKENTWPLAVFDGLNIGGTNGDPAVWYLMVRDERAGSVGTLDSWSIYLADHPPVSVETQSWGVVKSLYR